MMKQTLAYTALLSAGLLLSACGTPYPSTMPMSGHNQVQIAESVERLELYSRPDGLSLSSRDHDAVAVFLQNYARYGDGPVFMNVPQQFASAPGVVQTQGLVKQVMAQTGLAGHPVQTGYYQAQNGQTAPVVVSYRRLKTIAQDCRRLGNMSSTYNNQPYDGFGCSQTSNLATMVDDPRQFLEPYAFASSDTRRRMVVYDKYIEGETTAAEFPERQDISAESE